MVMCLDDVTSAAWLVDDMGFSKTVDAVLAQPPSTMAMASMDRGGRQRGGGASVVDGWREWREGEAGQGSYS